jgi:hypothetical protein
VRWRRIIWDTSCIEQHIGEITEDTAPPLANGVAFSFVGKRYE